MDTNERLNALLGPAPTKEKIMTGDDPTPEQWAKVRKFEDELRKQFDDKEARISQFQVNLECVIEAAKKEPEGFFVAYAVTIVGEMRRRSNDFMMQALGGIR